MVLFYVLMCRLETTHSCTHWSLWQQRYNAATGETYRKRRKVLKNYRRVNY